MKDSPPGRRPSNRGYFPVDVLVFGYLLLTGFLIIFSPLSSPAKGGYAYAHFGLLAAVGLLRFVPRDGHALLRFLRLTYPLIGLPFFYAGVQHLNRLITTRYFDEQIIRIEQSIFQCQPSQLLYSVLDWLPLSEFLHLAYAFYLLLVPIAAFTLFLTKRYQPLAVFATSVFVTFFFCYLVFIVYPVKGPFQHIGPIDPSAKGVFFPYLVHRLLVSNSSIGTAFPSSHVAVAITVWLVTRGSLKRLSPVFAVAAVGIFVGTVYGGFHYAVDALAGLAVGITLGILGPKIHDSLRRRLGMEVSTRTDGSGDLGIRGHVGAPKEPDQLGRDKQPQPKQLSSA